MAKDLSKLNYFKIEDLFWLAAKEHLWTFGYKGLPANIHFTIAFNKQTGETNFHVSHNPPGLQSRSIYILRMRNNRFAEIDRLTARIFIEVAFEPINDPLLYKSYKKKSHEIFYCSLERIQGSQIGKAYIENLQKWFGSAVQMSGRRALLKASGVHTLETNLNHSVNHKDITNLFRPLHQQRFEINEAGFMISPAYNGQAVKLGDKWYKPKQIIEPLEFLYIFFSRTDVDTLIFKIKMAIVRLRNLETKSEVLSYSKPLIFD